MTTERKGLAKLECWVPVDEKRRAREVAQRDGRSLANWLRMLVRDAIQDSERDTEGK